MKAVRLRAGDGGEIEVVEMPPPEAGPGEAIVRLSVAGICGSDLLDWYVRRKAGSVLGHEIVGSIDSIGPGVHNFKVGDRVVPHHHAPCLACDECRAGRFVHCAAWRASRLEPGGMAELLKVPAGNLAHDTLRVPDGVTDEEASWTEPLATVEKAFRRGGFTVGQSALVVGLGSAGQLAVRLALSIGASAVVGADRVASRLALAKASGAADTIDVSREDLASAAARLSGKRGFDFVFVCPGKPAVMRASAEAVAAGGTLLLFTMAAPGEELVLSAHDLYFREVRVVPSYSCGPDDMREALGRIASGRIAVADLVTHRFPLERAAEAFARARDPEGSLKVLLVAAAGAAAATRENVSD